jgi:ParB-like chromosome segregation protein Spo0J
MPDIVNMKLSGVDPNPMRRLEHYPYSEDKLAALMRSIRTLGMWPGIMARRHGDRVQIAFGHHRIEAAKRTLGPDAAVAIIVDDLTDEQMLQYMGHENAEDYHADFMVMLETWEATEDWLIQRAKRSENAAPTAPDIARFLGWVRPHPQRDIDTMDSTAIACNEAAKLVHGKYIKREDLTGLSASAVHEICQGVLSLHKEIDANAALGYRTPAAADEEKLEAGKAGAATADDARKGRVAKNDLRSEVRGQAYRVAKRHKDTPLFETFAKTLIDQIFKVAVDDSIGSKLNDIVKDIRAGHVKMREDLETIARVASVCESAEKRFAEWRRKLVVAAVNKGRVAHPPRPALKRIEVRR